MLQEFQGLTLQLIFLVLTGSTVKCCDRYFWKTDSFAIRILAASVTFCWILSLIFSILIPFGFFKPLPSVVCALIICVFVRNRFAYDDSETQPIFGLITSSVSERLINHNLVVKFVISVFIFFFFLHLFVGLVFPITAWDTFTYHGLKSSSWVQTGRWLTLDAPGAWEGYRSFLGGGEVYAAWAKLFLKSDVIEGIPDLAFWVLTTLVTYAISCQSGLSQVLSITVSIALTCNFEFHRWVNCAHVDTQATFFLLASLFFLIQFLRTRRIPCANIAFAASGLAACIKVNSMATVLVLIGVFFLMDFRFCWAKMRNWALWLCIFVSPILQWFAFNFFITGYPLGCAPVKLAGITLGALPPNLEWFLERPDLQPYVFLPEFSAFIVAICYFGFSITLSAVALPFFWQEFQKRSSEMFLGLAIIGSTFALFYSPSFSVIRLGWPFLNGRFVAPGIIAITAMAIYRLQSFRGGPFFLQAVALFSCVTNMYSYLNLRVWGRDMFEIHLIVMALFCTTLVLLLFLPSAMHVRRFLQQVSLLFTICLLIIVPPVFMRVKDSLREFYLFCWSFHTEDRGWTPGLLKILECKEPLHIAYGYGPEKIGHKVFIAPFMGKNFENRVSYISPEKSGKIVYFHPEHLRKSEPDFNVWIERLRKAEITHFVAFEPPGVEFAWAEKTPQFFHKLAGNSKSWGVYKFTHP